MDLLNSVQDYTESLQPTKVTYSGLLGLAIGGSRKVNIETRAGYVYVRLRDNLSEVIQAYNDKVSPVYDFPVLLVRKGNKWYITGKDDARYETFGTAAPFLPAHGDQHSFNRDGGGGGDAVFIYPDQFVPLLVYPSGTFGAGNLMVAPYALQRTNDFIYVGNTGTQNLLVYKPTNAQAIVGLVYLDKTTGNPGVLIASGTPMNGTSTGTASVLPYLPYPSSNQEPLYAFRLVSGTTSLNWNNLYNVRQFYGGSPSTGTSGGGISGIVVQDDGVAQGTGTVLNFVGDNISVSVSGTVARVFVTGSAGSSLPSFITGSVPFAGTDGILKENNPLLNFDEVNGTLWAGRKPPVNIAFKDFRFFARATGTNTSVAFGGIVAGTGTSGSPSMTFNGYKSRGTFEMPTPVQHGDALVTLIGNGFDGNDWRNAGRFRFYADNTWVTGAYTSTHAELEIIPSGSFDRRTQLFIYGDSVNQPTGSTYNVGGVQHTHAAGDVTSGVMATARLGSGTADSTKLLVGDNTWQARPTAQTATADIFRVDSPGGQSLFVATIASVSGNTLVYNAPSSGTDGVIVPTSSSQLAKMRLYNISNAPVDYLLISSVNTATNTITFTSAVPAGWVAGETVSIASQTVTGSGYGMFDLEITDTSLTGKPSLFISLIINSSAVGNRVTLHPFESFSVSKYKNIFAQVASVNNETERLIQINNNVVSMFWDGTPTVLVLRVGGYL